MKREAVAYLRAEHGLSERRACSIVGATSTINSLVTLICERSRPSRSQWAARASSLRGISSTVPVRFDSSAYWATMRSVFCSPDPPIMTGMREIGAGELTALFT